MFEVFFYLLVWFLDVLKKHIYSCFEWPFDVPVTQITNLAHLEDIFTYSFTCFHVYEILKCLFICIYVCASLLCIIFRGQNMMLDALNLKLKILVIYHVGTRYGTLLLCRNIKCSWPIRNSHWEQILVFLLQMFCSHWRPQFAWQHLWFSST